MAEEANPKAKYPASYGLPPRPPTASTPLWEHLLHPRNRAPTALTDMPIIAPPLGPLDKNATSMRILLHDTQANFEKFAKHVGQLFDEVKEAKQEMKTTHSLFERDRESLMGDIIDLVNRSQKEVQKSIGTPSQQNCVDNLFKDVNHRLSGLDQRLDALQAFNQTHTQALQTQIQAVQILLDKQGSIITAVLPLLPLLQAVPLHIDAAKANLSETLTKLLSDRNSTGDSAALPSATVHSSDDQTRKRKRINADNSLSPQSSVETPYKKARVDDISRDSAPKLPSVSNVDNSKAAVHPDEHTTASSSSALSSPLDVQDSSRRNQQSTKSTTGVSPPITDVRTAPLSSASRRGTFAVPTTATPRRPLGDLPIRVPSSRQSSARRYPSLLNHAVPEAPSERSCSLAAAFSAATLPGLTPTAARPPRILRVHASFANPNRTGTHSDVSRSVTPVATSHPIRGPIHHTPSFAGHTRPSPLAVSRTALVDKNFDIEKLETKLEAPADLGPRPLKNQATLQTISLTSPSIKPKSQSVPLAITLARLKDRRSPIREGRRFIPLVDSEDEENDEM
ncbi:hypothetical protein GALMADRAFT_283289 [Galerina marginata CBS 339.88]|uniref:Uncharacterized protein n=1 Tax=Galerina marginata (strain CBS 339.88) TaxID=685588 RepID=A0A067SAR5_GALM3|nr:hypothetical protein GALMADRAFT_283289 [Galerina marginata CBS 339.88]